MIKDFFKHNYAKIHEINKRYSKPAVEMTRGVKFALLCLRLYLIFLIVLLLYKFVLVAKGGA